MSECVHAAVGPGDCPVCNWDGAAYGFGYEPPEPTAYDNAIFELKSDGAPLCTDERCDCIVSWVAKDENEDTTIGAGDAMRWTPVHPVLRFT